MMEERQGKCELIYYMIDDKIEIGFAVNYCLDWIEQLAQPTVDITLGPLMFFIRVGAFSIRIRNRRR